MEDDDTVTLANAALLEAENARLREALRKILKKTREALGDESA